jgi:hypothetical protein
MKHKSWVSLASAAALISAAAIAQAQNDPQEEVPPPAHMLLAQGLGPEEGPGGPPPFGEGVELLGFEGMHGGKVVKGAPFSATATSDTTQTLQDGNTIHRTTKSNLYRDSEGRVRREITFSGFGPLQAPGKPRTMIMINDPVAGAHYMLNPDDKVAHKMLAHGSKDGAGPGKMFKDKGQGRLRRQQDAANISTDSLGTKIINGVNAEGTRVTHTIPAGQIGNDQPIRMVFERWYSPDLQMVIQSTRTDPRFGTTTYTVTNIQRNEPAAAMFSVPSDYTVKEGGPGKRARSFRGGPHGGAPADAPPAPPSGL